MKWLNKVWEKKKQKKKKKRNAQEIKKNRANVEGRK
jgi:hypothetical protein